MITYVINTSENKTFDSDQLFKLVGYKKIVWMNCELDDIEKCAEEICEKQNILGADDFRISVIIDFYSFDRVRQEYGLHGYDKAEKGVDISMYYPFVETYIYDHLFITIEQKDLNIREKDIFYIQNGKSSKYLVMDDEEKQLAYILEPKEDTLVQNEDNDEESKLVIKEDDEIFDQKLVDEIRKKELDDKMLPRYYMFNLYCSENVTLTFSLSDYPYTNKKGLTLLEFFHRFKLRESERNVIRRHYYYASFSGGPAKAAFDNLSLSLFLIKKYEREESLNIEGDIFIDKLNPDKLVDTLVLAWNKTLSAKEIALVNNSLYYDIEKYATFVNRKRKEEEPEEIQVKRYREIAKKEDKNPPKPKDAYIKVLDYAAHVDDDVYVKENEEEFDKIMTAYLKKRDDTKEATVENDFVNERESEEIKMITDCPSKTDFDNIIATKEKEISTIFDKALKAEFINVNFEAEKNTAEKAFHKYSVAKKSLEKSLFGDAILWFFVMAIMIIPYAFAQMKIERVSTVGAFVLYLYTIAILTGVFLLAFLIKIAPLVKKMNEAKKSLLDCYYSCQGKKKYSFSRLKTRYEIDLVNIEELRYEIRQISRLYEINTIINKRIDGHREMLEIVEDRLSSMLNNFGVEPVVVHYNNLDGEFDVTKSLQSPDNKVYKVFSLDTIEVLFEKGE